MTARNIIGFVALGGIRDSVDGVVTRPGVHKFSRNLRVTWKFEARGDVKRIPCWGNANIRRYSIKFKSPRPVGFRVMCTAELGYWLNAREIVSRFSAWAKHLFNPKWPDRLIDRPVRSQKIWIFNSTTSRTAIPALRNVLLHWFKDEQFTE
jgi:hypothetical protein